ncbi:XRE family transcriptional regulator [Candidatus Magnetobacterium bavaricum]|uniref:XRE family transcriptional regulator n=1 Tax=Candidatus Magnetobacterium bavaricum TaxID=29290 RepID=A0A0F3GMF3_9BACT|nr:XRE family transcriptional regulator [Candidatus Magnetobacterium bavaricum]
MLRFCPNCEAEVDTEITNVDEEIKVRRETFVIDSVFFKCLRCGIEFDDPNSDYDPLDAVYREYRRQHNMLQPEDIKNFRGKYGLTQDELSRLLRWSTDTLRNYENGALHNDAHDKLLRLIMQPHNLLHQMEHTPELRCSSKMNRLIDALKTIENVNVDTVRF